MSSQSLVLLKVWRSEIGGLLLFVVLSIVSILLTKHLPGSVITGKLISLGGYTVNLSLPLFGLVPVAAVVMLLFRIYNVRYLLDTQGIEARVGILALNQRIVRIRFEDIRSIETDQTMVDRMLDIGNLEIGTAATGAIEVTMNGINAPLEVQNMIQAERDRRNQLSRKRLGVDEDRVMSNE